MRRWGLTGRDADVIPLVVQGKYNDEIAAELGTSRKVIEGMVTKILKRAGYGSRNELAVAAWQYLTELDADASRLPARPEVRFAAEHGLTGRQALVLDHVVQGHTNREIARNLQCSARNVEFHVASILDKTGARSRTELIARYYRAGLEGWPPVEARTTKLQVEAWQVLGA